MKIHLSKFGQGLPLVFFHGLGFDSQIWLPLVTSLKADYELILIDLPGFGQSSMMDWQTFKQKLLKQLPPKFAVTGWSLGGLYAMRLALEAPERVSSVLNVCTSPCFIKQIDWPGVTNTALSRFKQLLAADFKNTIKEFIDLQSQRVPVNIIPGLPPSYAGLEAGLQQLDSLDLREELRAMQPPTAFLFGRLDPITPAATMTTMQALYPNFQYILFKKSAHMPFLSQREDFIASLVGFVQ